MRSGLRKRAFLSMRADIRRPVPARLTMLSGQRIRVTTWQMSTLRKRSRWFSMQRCSQIGGAGVVSFGFKENCSERRWALMGCRDAVRGNVPLSGFAREILGPDRGRVTNERKESHISGGFSYIRFGFSDKRPFERRTEPRKLLSKMRALRQPETGRGQFHSPIVA